jgi:hypothetical protein
MTEPQRRRQQPDIIYWRNLLIVAPDVALEPFPTEAFCEENQITY